MINHRFQALNQALNRKPRQVEYPSVLASEYFGSNIFDEGTLKKYLPLATFQRLKDDIENGKKIDRSMVDQVATAMKAWAISMGATHYTHWFQPLTGTTAEKHDAFLSFEDGNPIDKFSGNQLIQQEPDASSFPSGGIRSTFEARGYTAWDPNSPAFIRDSTLCIPSIFVSYTGEALDNKTPLLRAVTALDNAASAVAQYFDKDVKRVKATLGWEQEYFLVDSALYHARPDLLLTGRTVFGHSSAKNQQLEDHYFGVIPERVEAFMRDFEIEAHMLGIPVKTRHNEVAPNQYECAPIFEEINAAVDHNQLVMDVIEKVARRHDFHALLHEKPYAGVNGSGKHNNWSMATDKGENLLSPGRTGKENFRFMTFLINVVKAVHDHSPILRASIASASNELRLGGNEAPPAIISVFVGSYLSRMLQEFDECDNLSNFFKNGDSERSIKVQKIPEILLDNTDRNRTSPFAFTGNKFEFRAVGSSANCSVAMTALSTIVAAQLTQFRAEVELAIKAGHKKEDAIFHVLKSYIKDAKNVIFEGNNYGEEWMEEAALRGLPNINSTPEALKAMIGKKACKVYCDMNVLNETEMHARYEIELEKYIKKVQIEGRVIGDLAINHIIPTAVKYQNLLIDNAKGLKEIMDESKFRSVALPTIRNIEEISENMLAIQNGVESMTNERKLANRIDSAEEKAEAYHNKVMPWFDTIRYHVDKLELLVDDELWPLPKYRELLFTH
jgi:glutamine synthetase